MSTASNSQSNPSTSNNSARNTSASDPSEAQTGKNQASNPAKPSVGTPKNRKRPLRTKIFLFFAFALGLFVMFLMALPFCRITGNEFSPMTFQAREITLYRIPGINYQFIPSQYGATNSLPIAPEILKDLRTLSTPQVWHLRNSNSLGGDSFPADLLYKAITRRDSENESYWGSWSTQHPKRSKVLWPIIQSMAIANLYLQIPATLRYAEGYQGSDDAFSKSLLTEIHKTLREHQASFPNGNQADGSIDAQAEGIPEWSDVQNWLNSNPIPD